MKKAILTFAVTTLVFCAWAEFTIHVNAFDAITYAPDLPNDSPLDLQAEVLLNGQPFDPPAYTPYLFGADGNHPFYPGIYSVYLEGWNDWIPESAEFVDVICDYELDFLGIHGYDYVDLESFSANLTDENQVLLEWTTNFETGMLGYNVLRNPVQDPGGADVLNPGLIPATNSSEPHNYSFLDEEPTPGETTLFYWLELVTNDSSDIHGPVIVFLQVTDLIDENIGYPSEGNGLGRIYPNPFRMDGSARIEVSLREKGVLRIVNVLGQVVNAREIFADSREVIWDGRDNSGRTCASGVYLLNLATPSGSHTKKVVVIK
jgi:hypothetical protein